MGAPVYNPNTGKLRHEDLKIKANLSYVNDPMLKKEEKQGFSHRKK